MVSVCIATYNGAKYLKEQLESILCQLTESDEVVVSDDGSCDGTVELIRNYKDSRIHFFPNERRKGIVGNFENALLNASGEYIFLADQDDVWFPRKVQLCLKGLESNDLVLHDAVVVDSELNVLHDSFFTLRNVRRGLWRNLYMNGYIGCCMAFRKEFLKYLLPFPANIAMHDMWIGLRSELKGEVAFINTPLIYYRRHCDNASFTGEKSRLSIWDKFSYRFNMLRNVLFQ